MRLTRITLLIIALIIGAGFYLLLRRQLEKVEPQIFLATEESMVDTANLLASFVEADLELGGLDLERFDSAFRGAHSRQVEARIYNHLKKEVSVNAYITDSEGMVIFDSDDGKRVGMDLTEFHDVSRTLRGKYGARSSRENEDDPFSSILFVAAPIGDPTSPWGVLTVYKPQADVLPIVNRRRTGIWWGTGLIGGGILFLIAAVFIWQYRPVGQLTEYARAIEQGDRPDMPKLGAGREVNTLARALQSMRESLEGRRYAERYVQTLTHEMKSPLAAIRGAAELLDEDMTPEDRERFLSNIRNESARAERLLNRLLELSALEGRSQLDNPEEIDFKETTKQAIRLARPLAELTRVNIQATLPDSPRITVGDGFMLRAAITNLLENAIDFSPEGGTVEIVLLADEKELTLSIEDRGPGIPDYARGKVFDRFFSLRHHDSGRKGTGIGLTLVKEVVELHRGRITLDPAAPSGTRATLVFPHVS